QKKLIMLPSETMIWQPEFTDKTRSRKTGVVQTEFTESFQYFMMAFKFHASPHFSYVNIYRCILM
ncbi:hypothetical protein, partial [Escherichia coli]|uniref:hypothetical protein n=1 Tax=Escherichia coli TaxID=562 RepID=UPI001B8D5A54